MPIKPLNDWAVIVPSEAVERTAGGLYIPDAAKEKPAEGVVEAIGPGALEEEGYGKKKKDKKDRKFIATTVKPGERVLYERYAGTKVTVEGKDVVLVRERSILGIFVGGASSASPPLLIPSQTSSAATSLAKAALNAITAHAPVQPLKGSGSGGDKASAKKAGASAAQKKTATRTSGASKVAKNSSGKAPASKAAKKTKKKR